MKWKILQYAFAAALGGVGVWAAFTFGPGLMGWVEGQDLVVESPIFLWGLLLIPVLIILRAHTLSDLPKVQQALSVLLRAAIVVAIVGSLIDVQKIDREPKKMAVVFVVDVSESVPDEVLAKTRDKLQEAWAAKGDGQVRLVIYGGEAREVELPVGQPNVPPIPRLPNAGDGSVTPVDDPAKATDTLQALRLAFGLFPEERLKRVVLVTDGLDTRGSALVAQETAKRFDIPVHYLDFTDVPRPGELMVLGVNVPDNVKANIPFSVRSPLKTTQPMLAQCELKIDGLLEKTKDVELGEGAGEVVFDDVKVKEGGDKKIAVTCKADSEQKDRFASNNTFEVPVKVPEKPKLLYVEGERKYRKNLLAALDKDFRIELRGERGVPSTLADAKQFDLIFVSDVPRSGNMGYANMSTGQMRVLEKYARAGGGIIFAGGENSFGPGGYGGTYLERKVLPVRLDVQKKEDIPGLALMLVIDRSGSMSGTKIELAKEAARATMEVLQPSDKLGVIAFDSNPTEIVRLQRASNRLRITDSLRRLTAGGGTDIFPALDRAYQVMTATRAKVKHIILLTDGQSSKNGILELVQANYEQKITISTVAVGRGSDQRLMQNIAEHGGGRYYFTDRADNIPKLFLKETSEVSRRALVEDRFVPRTAKRFRRLQMFSGLNMRRVPALLGYVSTRAKPRAEVLMTSHLGEPVLARWRLGLGKVVVWTSDVKNRWAHYWLKWDGYAKFWRQVIRDSARVEKEKPTFNLVADIAQGVLEVGVDAVDDDDKFIDGLVSEVKVIDPKGVEIPVTLTQTAAGRYEGKLPLEQYGPYTVVGEHHPKGAPDDVHESYAALAWPFPDEHLVGDPDLTVVKRLAEGTGGVESPTSAQLFDPGDAKTEKREPLRAFPLYVALGLLLLDVLLRRVRFYGRTSIKWEEVRG